MKEVHQHLGSWMKQLGMHPRLDAMANLRGIYAGAKKDAPVLYLGSHLDTVPGAGAYDGVLGVVLALSLVEALGGRRLPFAIEVVGFSEEEGVRFGVPFLGSRALVGRAGDLLQLRDAGGVSVADAILSFGLDPNDLYLAEVGTGVLGYLEIHIEQGPVLESLDLPLGVVQSIVGQSRLEVRFRGKANHAGTTPMHLRHDALAGAAEWIHLVEKEAQDEPGLVATVGQIKALPGAGNVIAGEVQASLDVRHAEDEVRTRAVAHLITRAQQAAQRRGLELAWETKLDHPAVPCNPELTELLAQAVEQTGRKVHLMPSGAGHDAMVMAEKMPVAMLFVRSPGGVSHHPDERVLAPDVRAALEASLEFLALLEKTHA